MTPPGQPLAGHPPLEGEGASASDEAAAKALLAAAGLPVPFGRRAADAVEAVAAADAFGYPVALKALGVAHKSEAGAVKLNLGDADAVREAANGMARLGTGLYVERMVTGGVAELIVGITRDPLFGPVMTVGTGGVLVELLKDSRTLLLPSSREDIEAALRSLKMFALLDGYRGRPRADLAAAIGAILGIADFALDHADTLEELDINPLIVCEQGAWVADALMVVSSTIEGEVTAKRPEGVTSGGAPLSHTSAATPPVQSPAAIVHPPLKGEGSSLAIPTPTGVAGRPSPQGGG